MNMPVLVQGVVDRINSGHTVPVKKEFREDVVEKLEQQYVAYTIDEDKTDPNRVLFRPACLVLKDEA